MAHPGEELELRSAGFRCGYRYPRDHSYKLIVQAQNQPYSRQLGSFPVARDGHLDVSVLLPRDLPPGVAFVIVVAGSPYNGSCPDTVSCAGYSALVKIEA